MTDNVDYYRAFREGTYEELTLTRELIESAINQKLQARWGDDAPAFRYERDVAPDHPAYHICQQFFQDYMDLAKPPQKIEGNDTQR